MDALTFIILALAVWRVCRMFVQEEGPFGIFDLLRAALKVHLQSNWVQRGLSCVACVSFWMGLCAGVIWRGVNIEGIATGLAISAISVVLTRRVG